MWAICVQLQDNKLCEGKMKLTHAFDIYIDEWNNINFLVTLHHKQLSIDIYGNILVINDIYGIIYVNISYHTMSKK